MVEKEFRVYTISRNSVVTGYVLVAGFYISICNSSFNSIHEESKAFENIRYRRNINK